MEEALTYIKPRVFVLTDIENEPDDAMSMVRFLTYANQWDIEGLVATTSIHLKDKTASWRIKEIVNAYGKVRDLLETHETGFPSEEFLLSIIKDGLPVYGLEGVGEDKDSEGSELLIKALKRNDERTLWVLVWGGPNVLAQALWRLSTTLSTEEFNVALKKVRVYAISDQDDSGPWLRKTFPDLFYIVSPGFHAGGAYHYSTWSGISGDFFHGRFSGADFSTVDNLWLDKHIRAKGELGKVYPQSKYLMEGDTPTFLYLIKNGLGHPEHPNWGSWGGRYELQIPPTKNWFLYPEERSFWSDCDDEVKGIDNNWYTTNKATIWRWREAYQNDFSARMDWTIKPFQEANHPPVPKLSHSQILFAKQGDIVHLDATGTTDPDGDEVSYHWFYYSEAGTFSTSMALTAESILIHDENQQQAWFTIPMERVFKNGTIHIILAVTDHGKPPLTRYKRVIINVS